MHKKDHCEHCANKPALEDEFKKDVQRRAKAIDPENGEDWYSLTLGYAIGKGLTPRKAHDFAVHIRYDTELG